MRLQTRMTTTTTVTAMTVMTAMTMLLAPAALAGAGDGTLYVLNKSDANVSPIDTATGAAAVTIPVGDGPHEAAVSPDGKTLVVCNYGRETPGRTLTVIDTATGEVRGTMDLREYHRPHGIAFIPGTDHILVTAEPEKKLLLIDVESGELLAAIGTGQDISHMVAVTPDGRRAFVANIGSGSISAIDLVEHKLIKSIPTGDGAEGLAVHPTRPEVWVTNRKKNTIAVVNTGTLEVETLIVCPQFPLRIAFTPDGVYALVSNAQTGDVAVLNVESRTIWRRLSMDEEPVADGEKEKRLFSDTFGQSPVPVGIVIRPDGHFAYVANTNADVISVIDLKRWEVVGRLHAGKEPDGLAWAPAKAD